MLQRLKRNLKIDTKTITAPRKPIRTHSDSVSPADSIYGFHESKVFLMEGNSNPDHTPKIFFTLYLSREDAMKDQKRNPEIFHDFLIKKWICCPSCKERKELGLLGEQEKKVWKTKEWFIGFELLPKDPTVRLIQVEGIFIEPKARINLEQSNHVEKLICPRCAYWKEKW